MLAGLKRETAVFPYEALRCGSDFTAILENGSITPETSRLLLRALG
jgi:hypothetical protein